MREKEGALFQEKLNKMEMLISAIYVAIHAEINAGYSDICYHCGNDNILNAGGHATITTPFVRFV